MLQQYELVMQPLCKVRERTKFSQKYLETLIYCRNIFSNGLMHRVRIGQSGHFIRAKRVGCIGSEYGKGDHFIRAIILCRALFYVYFIIVFSEFYCEVFIT